MNDDQPTASFPRLPYPSAADAADATPAVPAPVPDEAAQPTTSFPRLPYPSAAEAAAAREGAAPEPPADAPQGWRARRRAAKARAAAEAAAGRPAADTTTGDDVSGPPEPEPLGTVTDVGTDLPGPLAVPDALATSPRGLRRQRRRLLNERDQLVFHLGGLAYELHRLGELSAPVAQRRAGMIYELDATVSAIDAQLAARSSTKAPEQRLPIVVGSCRTCHTLFVAEARYCMKCGAVLAPAEHREPTP